MLASEAYFARVVSYICKMIMKSNIGVTPHGLQSLPYKFFGQAKFYSSQKADTK